MHVYIEVASWGATEDNQESDRGVKEDMQLHYIQGLNELKMNMDTITKLTFWEELFSTYERVI